MYLFGYSSLSWSFEFSSISMYFWLSMLFSKVWISITPLEIKAPQTCRFLEYIILVLSYASPGETHLCLPRHTKYTDASSVKTTFSFLILFTKFKSAFLIYFIVSEKTCGPFNLKPFSTKNLETEDLSIFKSNLFWSL